MSFLDAFEDEKNTSVTITRKTTVDNTTTGKQVKSTSTIGTLLCIFWVGKQAESVVSEKIRGIVSAVAVFDPGSNVLLHDILIINGQRYNALDPDNVGNQDDALIVPLEAIK